MAAAGNGVFIRFDPAKILDASAKLERQHGLFAQCTANIKKKADSLKGVWQGGSAELYSAKMGELDAWSARCAKQFIFFSQELADASGIYAKSEAGAKQKAQALPTEGVFKV